MLADAFRGHGTFIYEAAATIGKYGSAEAVAKALVRAGMKHAWIRLHGYKMTPEPEDATDALITALKGENIALAGWGFVPGSEPEKEAGTAARMVKDRKLTHYVADIEKDEHGSEWVVETIPTFLKELRKQLPSGAQITVSSYPYIGGKHPELMRAAVPYVEAFAPQIYWLDYPAPYMLEPGNLPPHPSRPYKPTDKEKPAVYADLCLDWWRATVGQKPLILTGQAYWEGEYPMRSAEKKLDEFLRTFQGWSRVVGANWWHLGHKDSPPNNGAMTEHMFDTIVAAHLNTKPFAAA